MTLPQKRRRRRRGDSSRRRRGDDGASLSGSHVEPSDSSSRTNSGDDPSPSDTGTAYESRYQSLLASRLARLRLPPGADDDDNDDDDDSPNLPSYEILQTLGGPYFNDDEMQAALLQDQVYKYSKETPGEQDSVEFNSADVAMALDSGDLVDPDDTEILTHDDFLIDSQLLQDRTAPPEDPIYLEGAEVRKLRLKHALYRIKALMMLKGKPIDKLDDAALRTKYPPELILNNDYFVSYEDNGTLGWHFDNTLCMRGHLSDYQRLLPSNYGLYRDWDKYGSYNSTPETDQEFLLYCEEIAKKIKWIEGYVLAHQCSDEWREMESKGMFQAIRIATKYTNISLDLAYLGYTEFLWSMRSDRKQKELGDLYFEIWKQVTMQEKCFGDALMEVNDPDRFPWHQRMIKSRLEHRSITIERRFREFTLGITKQVPIYRARELIAKQVKYETGWPMKWGYEQYARKKLKIAELLGPIPKLST